MITVLMLGLDVAGKGCWGDIVSAPNDLLFLHAEIQYPRSHNVAPPPASGHQ